MSEFTKEKLAELRAVAEAATPGPWVFDPPGMWGDEDDIPQSAVRQIDSGSITWDDHGGEVFKPEDAAHIATFDPPTVLALIAALEAKTAEADDLAADPGHKAAKYWKWWQREKARADRAEDALERVRESRAGHPECDKYDEGSPVSCGWKRTVQSIDAALQAIEGADDA